jgi:hypothetical protein
MDSAKDPSAGTIPPKIVIYRSNPSKGQSAATIAEQRRCRERMERNAGMYTTMSRWLATILHQKVTKDSLLRFAEKMALKLNVPIDRDARRLKDCLICWICENAPQLVVAEPATIGELLPEIEIQPSNGNSREWDSTDGFGFEFEDFGFRF